MSNPIETGIQNRISESKLFSPVEWPSKEISEGADAIRLFYFRQIPLLRQIPYLALEANGRGGWSGRLSRAYYRSMIEIDESRGYYLFLELRTGVLLTNSRPDNYNDETLSRRFGLKDNSELFLATDREIFTKLVIGKENKIFTPSDLIDELQERIKRPYHQNPEEVERQIAMKEIARVGLDRMMEKLPEEQVIENLRTQGIEI